MADTLTTRIAYLRSLVDAHNAYSPTERTLIYDALTFAQQQHGTQLRKSGEPFFIHPLETAISLVEWHQDAPTVATGLLHDVLEDTEVSTEELAAKFGDEVCALVEAVTKIALAAKKHRDVPEQKAISSEYQMRLFAFVARDPRAMIVKLADRWHNLRTLSFLSPTRQRAIAQETFDVYANIAGRLGMYALKTLLLDGSFAIIDATNYGKTVSLINEYKLRKGEAWKRMETRIRALLDEARVPHQLESRTKGVWSTFQKLNGSSRLSNIHDIFALRVIVNQDLDIYHALGLIHLNFRHIPRFFKDYVSLPKQNLYQSIHTTILDGDAPVEIQIRTCFMDENSKYGIASHWRYKENHRGLLVVARDRLQLDAFMDATGKSDELIKQLVKTPTVDVIVTNDGKIHSVPATSSILELAYRYDAQRFPYAQAAFRFGEKLPWDARLENGDAIEFVYGTNPFVNQRWLRYVSHPVVRKAINELLRAAEAGENASTQRFLRTLSDRLAGKCAPAEEIQKRLRALGLNSLHDFAEYAVALNLSEHDAHIYFASGSQWREVAKTIRRRAPRWAFYRSYFEYVDVLKVEEVQAPKCCTKLPGQQVVGVISKNILYAHRPDCAVVHGSTRKLVPLRWSQRALTERPRKFLAKMTVTGPWGAAAPNTVINEIVKVGGSIHGLQIERNKSAQTFCATIALYVQDYAHFTQIVNELSMREANFICKMI